MYDKLGEMSIRGYMKIIFIFAVTIIFIMYILKPQKLHIISFPDIEFLHGINYSGDSDHSRYLVASSQCRILNINPWDKSIQRFYKSLPVLHCSKYPLLSSIVDMKNGTYVLQINKDVIHFYKDRSTDVIKCCYSNITRINEVPESYDKEADNKFSYSKCKNFQSKILLPNTTEFLRVKCMLYRNESCIKEVYRDAHAVVPILQSALKKLNNFTEEKKKLKSRRLFKSQENIGGKPPTEKLNVLILGIDSVSRLNLRRAMPETFSYLQKNKWIELNGYTKIEDNTFPNLMAILSGHNMSDLYHICYQNRYKSLDDCPFIWKQFNDSGYITAYAEDVPLISTFNYQRTGFVEKPTDYYLRPFMLAIDSSLTKKKLFGLPACNGPVASVEHIFNYARRFLSTFKDYNHFSLFWMNSLSHNNPTGTVNMDHRTLKFFKDLSSLGTYNNTIIFFLSDHGTRFGDFRHTFVGYYEERLPFMFIWLPEWFKEKYPRLYAKAVINQKRLTSPFDIHLTLKKILKGDYDDDAQSNQKYLVPSCPKCISLFDTIPWNRSCHDASIPEFWCMCDEFHPVKISEPIIGKLGQFVKNSVLNKAKEISIKEKYKKFPCAIWTFNKVIRAHQIIFVKNNPYPNNNENYTISGSLAKMDEKLLYMILVELNPGKTKFEAMVEVHKSQQQIYEIFKLNTSPSRLDGYAKYSECVEPTHLKYYCFCNNIGKKH